MSESELLEQYAKIKLLAGCDEVGRGPLVGDVVAGATATAPATALPKADFSASRTHALSCRCCFDGAVKALLFVPHCAEKCNKMSCQ